MAVKAAILLVRIVWVVTEAAYRWVVRFPVHIACCTCVIVLIAAGKMPSLCASAHQIRNRPMYIVRVLVGVGAVRRAGRGMAFLFCSFGVLAIDFAACCAL
jgi:hypothetical protein